MKLMKLFIFKSMELIFDKENWKVTKVTKVIKVTKVTFGTLTAKSSKFWSLQLTAVGYDICNSTDNIYAFPNIRTVSGMREK